MPVPGNSSFYQVRFLDRRQGFRSHIDHQSLQSRCLAIRSRPGTPLSKQCYEIQKLLNNECLINRGGHFEVSRPIENGGPLEGIIYTLTTDARRGRVPFFNGLSRPTYLVKWFSGASISRPDKPFRSSSHVSKTRRDKSSADLRS